MIPEPNNTLLEHYLTLQAQIDALQAQRDEMRDEIFELLSDVPVTHSGFTFSKAKRVSYTHPQAVKVQEKALKEAKKLEIEQGIATATKETEFLTVRKAKAA